MHVSQKVANKKYGLVLPLVNQEKQPVSRAVFEQDRYKNGIVYTPVCAFFGAFPSSHKDCVTESHRESEKAACA